MGGRDPVLVDEHRALLDRLEDASRGEPYAEAHASRVLDEVWPAYIAALPT